MNKNFYALVLLACASTVFATPASNRANQDVPVIIASEPASTSYDKRSTILTAVGVTLIAETLVSTILTGFITGSALRSEGGGDIPTNAAHNEARAFTGLVKMLLGTAMLYSTEKPSTPTDQKSA